MAERFALLKYEIAVVLMFVGCKMLIAPWIKIPTLLALGVAGILAFSVWLSLRRTRLALVASAQDDFALKK